MNGGSKLLPRLKLSPPYAAATNNQETRKPQRKGNLGASRRLPRSNTTCSPFTGQPFFFPLPCASASAPKLLISPGFFSAPVSLSCLLLSLALLHIKNGVHRDRDGRGRQKCRDRELRGFALRLGFLGKGFCRGGEQHSRINSGRV
jgi:hypothetical protein